MLPFLVFHRIRRKTPWSSPPSPTLKEGRRRAQRDSDHVSSAAVLAHSLPAANLTVSRRETLLDIDTVKDICPLRLTCRHHQVIVGTTITDCWARPLTSTSYYSQPYYNTVYGGIQAYHHTLNLVAELASDEFGDTQGRAAEALGEKNAPRDLTDLSAGFPAQYAVAGGSESSLFV